MDPKTQTFKEAVVTLQNNLSTAIAVALAEFKRDTAVTPSDIDIDMVDVSKLGDDLKGDYALGNVRVRFKF